MYSQLLDGRFGVRVQVANALRHLVADGAVVDRRAPDVAGAEGCQTATGGPTTAGQLQVDLFITHVPITCIYLLRGSSMLRRGYYINNYDGPAAEGVLQLQRARPEPPVPELPTVLQPEIATPTCTPPSILVNHAQLPPVRPRRHPLRLRLLPAGQLLPAQLPEEHVRA